VGKIFVKQASHRRRHPERARFHQRAEGSRECERFSNGEAGGASKPSFGLGGDLELIAGILVS
jgi:hypothetical protein